MKHLKYKIIVIFTLLIIIVSSIITFYNLYRDAQENERRLNDAYANVQRTYTETILDTTHFYHSRAEANLRSPGILEAFAGQNHDQLYSLMRPRWEVMQKENPWLSVMQFHNADGTSLLRLHQPTVYGDKIASQRSMVAYAHKTQQRVAGFEEGRQGLAFRVLIPAFHEGVYIGAVEFGISVPYFTDKIYRFAGYDAFFFVHQNALGAFGRIGEAISIGEYRGISIPLKYRPLIKHYGDEYQKLENRTIYHNHQTYAITVLSVNDYRSKPVGAIMFARATTDFKAHVRHMILSTLLIAIGLILLIAISVDRVYAFIMLKMSFQERYSQMILDSVPAPVIVTDGRHLIAANDSFLGYFHYSTVALFKKDHACVCEYFESGNTDEYLMPMHDDQRWTEYIIAHPLKSHKAKITLDGVSTVFEVRISVLKVSEETRYVVIFNDISAMQIQTMTDPLTGVANRLHFTMVYQHAINIARRSERSLGMILFDIDHFKNVNDTYGHLVGDKVLKHIASIVAQRIRKSDVLARWGGEEFVVLLSDSTLDEAINIAQILRGVIEKEDFEEAGNITCSFGVAALEKGDDAETFLKRTDDRLYEAKENGRNKVVF